MVLKMMTEPCLRRWISRKKPLPRIRFIVRMVVAPLDITIGIRTAARAAAPFSKFLLVSESSGVALLRELVGLEATPLGLLQAIQHVGPPAQGETSSCKWPPRTSCLATSSAAISL